MVRLLLPYVRIDMFMNHWWKNYKLSSNSFYHQVVRLVYRAAYGIYGIYNWYIQLLTAYVPSFATDLCFINS